MSTTVSRTKSNPVKTDTRFEGPATCRNGQKPGWWIGLCVAVVIGPLSSLGCRGPETPALLRPARHSIRSGQLLLLSDFKLSKNHPLVQDLITLRKQVAVTLDLPAAKEEVVVYIFTTKQDYQRFLNIAHPGLPNRRAYFVGTQKELAVYTFWGSRIHEDLRHESTHGLLHSSLKTVPLWLDEGLAEYFEVTGPRPGSVNSDYAHRLAASLANGWRPDLRRLEKIEKFSQLQYADYQESWAWVHFMLHSSPETRDVLLSYLHDLRTQRQPVPLSKRLAGILIKPQERFISYIASLRMTHALLERTIQPTAGEAQSRGFSDSRTGRVRLPKSPHVRIHPR
ncbi:MAG: DUF1570 domain-containing protein [Planctomycetes bacterium]|nr:DUF1570 domain-containing protein [Planctomycetota bacterium]